MSSGRPTDDVQRLLDALSSPVRRDILWLVWDRELAAGDIAAAFDLSPPTISEHLSVLRAAELVSVARDGTYRRYRARPEAMAGLQRLFGPVEPKFVPSAAPPPSADTRTVAVVMAETDAPCAPATAFQAFTDAALYTRWAGVPVSLVDGRFSLTMEWGLTVRGTYDHVVAPTLVVMSWDFDLGEVPLPGAPPLRAYLEISPRDGGRASHVAVHQLVAAYRQARKMERVWGLMLARFRDNVLAAVDPTVDMPLRPRSTRR